jgi:predicted DNA-binding transcriptional regulator YafY
MLRLLPRAPRKIDTARLEAMLAEAGFTIDRRSVQRDLQELSAHFPIECDSDTKPYGWSWSRDAAPFDLPAMDVHAALAFRVASEHLEHLIPASTRQHLEPYFKQAKLMLSHAHGGLGEWPANVVAIHTGPMLLPPQVDPNVLEAVHDALIDARRLSVVYRKRGATDARTYELSPLALVYRDAVAILVASASEYAEALQFPLHRMVSAAVTEKPRRLPPNFNLDELVRGGDFDFRLSDTPLSLEAVVHPTVAVKLSETPLSRDQRLEPEPSGRTRLFATVADTNQLRAWLRSFGAYVEIIGPPALRQQMMDEAAALAQVYAVPAAPGPSQA